jgi:hypothetical protein
VARKVTTNLQRVKGSVVARWKVGARPVLMLNNFLEMESTWRDVPQSFTIDDQIERLVGAKGGAAQIEPDMAVCHRYARGARRVECRCVWILRLGEGDWRSTSSTDSLREEGR